MSDLNWDAGAFFEELTAKNKMAIDNGFKYCRVSGLDGFEGAFHDFSLSISVCGGQLLAADVEHP